MVGSSSSLTILARMIRRQRVLCESTTPQSVGFSKGLTASMNCWCVGPRMSASFMSVSLERYEDQHKALVSPDYSLRSLSQ
jgi:hypothetical protein